MDDTRGKPELDNSGAREKALTHTRTPKQKQDNNNGADAASTPDETGTRGEKAPPTPEEAWQGIKGARAAPVPDADAPSGSGDRKTTAKKTGSPASKGSSSTNTTTGSPCGKLAQPTDSTDSNNKNEDDQPAPRALSDPQQLQTTEDEKMMREDVWMRKKLLDEPRRDVSRNAKRKWYHVKRANPVGRTQVRWTMLPENEWIDLPHHPRYWGNLGILKVGGGGFGGVYRTWDLLGPGDGRFDVVLKYQHFSRHFLREVQALRHFSGHPRFPRFHNIFFMAGKRDEPEWAVIVMESCRQSVNQLLKGDPVSRNTADRIMYETLEGVAYMHACGVMNRDIKPHNILIQKDVQVWYFHVKLGDFGTVANNVLDASQKQEQKEQQKENEEQEQQEQEQQKEQQEGQEKQKEEQKQKKEEQEEGKPHPPRHSDQEQEFITKGPHVGTANYRAPEVHAKKPYNKKIDSWSLAATLFQVYYHTQHPLIPTYRTDKMMFEYVKRIIPPQATRDERKRSLKELVERRADPARNQVIRPADRTPEEEELFFDLLSGMLVYDPSERMTAAAALKHPFFKRIRDRLHLYGATPADAPAPSPLTVLAHGASGDEGRALCERLLEEVWNEQPEGW